MAKQTFTTGQVLSAAQVNALQANDYNTTVSTKTASYVLVAGDVGTTIVQNVATANTVTVNNSLFAAGDTLRIQNIGAGIATITAGTATVNTANSLALPQWGSGILYFTSASAAIFFPSAGAAGTSPVVKMVSLMTTAAATGTTQIPLDNTIPQNTEGDQYMSLAITPSSASNILLIQVIVFAATNQTLQQLTSALFKDSVADALATGGLRTGTQIDASTSVAFNHTIVAGTTSAITFKVRVGSSDVGTTTFNGRAGSSSFGAITKSSIIITEYTP